MSLAETSIEVEYPETDGMPMGETDLHRYWKGRIHELLSIRYQRQRVYVGADLMVYYAEGEPWRYVVPDDFVALDCPAGDRSVFKTWEEGKSPDVTVEITSRSTKKEDTTHKPALYARLGVGEYFLYDPTGKLLTPPLQGLRLQGDEYERIEPDASGRLKSEQLGVYLHLDDGRLVMTECQTGEALLTEAEQARRDADQKVKQAEQKAEHAEQEAEEQARARAAAEDEVRRLREQLEQQGGDAR